MADRSRDVRVRILSEYYDEGSKAAERATRRLANMQMSAAREMAAAEAARAAEVERANQRQAVAMQTVGRTTLMISAAIAAGLGIATKSAMDWESAWAGVRKTVDGSPEEMASLEAELRGLARTLPATHEEIAGVAEAAGQLGVKRADVAGFTRTMIDLGETTNLSAEEAATSLARMSNIMGIGNDQASKLGSTIVALGNNSATTERDILNMGLRIAGAGRTVGMTADQVLAMAASLSSVGIEAEAGGSAISKVMIQIDNDVATGKGSLETYARVAGMTADQFATAWRDNAGDALNRFLGGLGQMRAEGKNTTAVLQEMGFTEMRVSDALRRASLASDLVTASLELGSKAWEENNALVAEAEQRYATTESRLQVARNQINDAAIDIGGNFLPVLAQAAEGAGALAVGFGQLPAPAKSFVAQLGAAAAGLTGVVGGAAVVIPKLGELRKTLDDLHGGSSRAGKAIGGIASFLTGPWGLALAGATIAVGAWMKAQGEAALKTQALADTLDEQTGALTENTSAWIQAELTKKQSFGLFNDQSMVSAAKQMGISIETLTRAYEGQPDAIAKAKAAAEDYAAANWDIGLANESLSNRFVLNLEQQSHRLQEAREIQRAKLEIDRHASAAQGEYADAVDTTVGALKEQADALQGTTEEASLAEDALEGLARMLDDLNSATLNARDAERNFKAAIDEVTEAKKKATEEGIKKSKMLDTNTEAGRRNEATLDALARAGIKYSQTVLEETGSEEKFRAALDESRNALYEAARQLGMTEEAAWEYVDSVLAVPDEVTTEATFNVAKAEQTMNAFVKRWSGYGIPMHVNMSNDQALAAIQRVQRARGINVQMRDGGVVDYFANGSEHHVAQIAPAGAWRVWAEPETGGEAYIPLSPAKRARSEAILEDVAARFGMYVGRYADGAVLGARSQAPAPTVGGVTIGTVYTTDIDELARTLVETQRDAVTLHNLESVEVG